MDVKTLKRITSHDVLIKKLKNWIQILYRRHRRY